METFGRFFTAATLLFLPQMGYSNEIGAAFIKGDGDPVVKKTEVSVFTDLVVNFGSSSEDVTNNITVVLQKTGNQKVSVYAEKNLQSYIEIKPENGTLYLSIRKGKKLSPTSAITIYVDASTLKNIKGKGNVRLTSVGPLAIDTLNISFDGILNGFLDVDVKQLSINITGVYEFGVSGKATKATLKTSGVGTLDHSLLVANKLEAKVNSISKKDFHSLAAQR